MISSPPEDILVEKTQARYKFIQEEGGNDLETLAFQFWIS